MCPDFYETKKTDNPKQIAYGIRSTIRKIKEGKCDIVILSAELKPRYVINQVILLALAHNEAVNIFCVPNLAEIMKEFISFPCFAFTLIVNDRECTKLDDLLHWCAIRKEQSHPVPNTITEYFSLKNNRKPVSEDVEVNLLKLESDEKDSESVDFTKLYLIKKTEGPKRLFVPENASDLKPLLSNVARSTFDQSDFISLSSSLSIDEDEEAKPTEKMIYVPSNQILPPKKGLKRKNEPEPRRQYHNLTINKVQGNPQKVKKDKKKLKEKFFK